MQDFRGGVSACAETKATPTSKTCARAHAVVILAAEVADKAQV